MSTQQTPVYLLIFDGFADWEPALACAELNKSPRFVVRTVGFSTDTVVSMAGLKVTPDMRLADVDPAGSALLVLPGGDMWEQGERPELTEAMARFRAAGVPIAAICAGTLAAGHAGLLNSRRHTSNFAGYIALHVPNYGGSALYSEASAVTDDGVITASGMGSVEFAYEILALLALYGADDLQIWARIFKDKAVPKELIP